MEAAGYGPTVVFIRTGVDGFETLFSMLVAAAIPAVFVSRTDGSESSAHPWTATRARSTARRTIAPRWLRRQHQRGVRRMALYPPVRHHSFADLDQFARPGSPRSGTRVRFRGSLGPRGRNRPGRGSGVRPVLLRRVPRPQLHGGKLAEVSAHVAGEGMTTTSGKPITGQGNNFRRCTSTATARSTSWRRTATPVCPFSSTGPNRRPLRDRQASSSAVCTGLAGHLRRSGAVTGAGDASAYGDVREARLTHGQSSTALHASEQRVSSRSLIDSQLFRSTRIATYRRRRSKHARHSHSTDSQFQVTSASSRSAFDSTARSPDDEGAITGSEARKRQEYRGSVCTREHARTRDLLAGQTRRCAPERAAPSAGEVPSNAEVKTRGRHSVWTTLSGRHSAGRRRGSTARCGQRPSSMVAGQLPGGR